MSDDISTLLNAYKEGPSILRAAVEKAEPSEFDLIPVPGKWSIRQVVCHISDFEPVYADRFKRVLVEDNPTIFGGDPDAYAAGLAYGQRSVESELAYIEATREHMLPILQQCDIEQYQRTGVHSEDGPMTLETLINRIVGHIPHHVKFIEEKVAALRGSGGS